MTETLRGSEMLVEDTFILFLHPVLNNLFIYYMCQIAILVIKKGKKGLSFLKMSHKYELLCCSMESVCSSYQNCKELPVGLGRASADVLLYTLRSYGAFKILFVSCLQISTHPETETYLSNFVKECY